MASERKIMMEKELDSDEVYSLSGQLIQVFGEYINDINSVKSFF